MLFREAVLWRPRIGVAMVITGATAKATAGIAKFTSKFNLS
jgi:hypothetical protein